MYTVHAIVKTAIIILNKKNTKSVEIMEWMIVHFLHDNVIETVPSCWVYDDICYWPPYKGSKLNQAISSCITPVFGEWTICQIRQLADGHKYRKYIKYLL